MTKLPSALAAIFFLLFSTLALHAQTIPLVPERTGHAATLLPSGNVLISGGVNENATLSSAILYNPTTNVFTATGSMITARANHTSTLLYTGKVLVTGGDNSVGALQSAELYDPATGTWTQTKIGMKAVRTQHTATVLWDGKVLLDGGKSADVYNPADDTFTATAGLPVNRKSHMASLLPDGTVLITGGYVDNISSNTAEIYDPNTQIFTLLANTMGIARANHTSTLLPSGVVFITGGFSGTSPHKETEVYDPASQTFTSDTNMLYNRSNQRAILQGDGRVLIIGGVTLESGFLAADEVYDPATKTWTLYDSLVENRAGHTATALLSGKVLVVGGVTGNQTLQSAEILDPVTHAFTSIGNMKAPRNEHRATLLDDGKVLLEAGSTDAVNLISAELFDPSNNSFTLVGSIKDARKSHTATKLQDGRVVITGGKGGRGGDLTSAEVYDPTTQLWHLATPMAEERALHTATLLNSGKVLVVGGVQTGGGVTATTELFDPATETFSLSGSLALGRKRHRESLLLSGKVLVSGGNFLENGQSGGERETDTAELYDPANGLWTSVENMSSVRSEHESTLLTDGTVLISGGILIQTPSEVYDPSALAFSDVGEMIQTRGRHVALRLKNPAWGSLVGHVLAIGGDVTGGSVFGGGQQAFDSVEIYDPGTDQFSSFGTMTVARQNHSATELNDGRILIAGGVGRPFVSATGELLDGPTPSPTPPPTPTPSPTSTISPSPSPSPSATPAESKPLNISTRGDAQTGDRVLIGGFILTGGTESKSVIIRAIGPSLASNNPPVAGALVDPVLELHKSDGSVITNDNWRDTQPTAIEASGLAPTNDLESAIIATLVPVDPAVPGSGIYTAIVYGKDNGTGIGLVEVYDLDDPNAATYLANISTRGYVQTGDKAMIGGFIIGAGAVTGDVVVRAIGPSLTGVTDALQDPTLSLYNAQGLVVGLNDDWQTPSGSEVEATGLAPSDPRESAILASLPPGAYTALVEGKGGSLGIGLVEVYYLPSPVSK